MSWTCPACRVNNSDDRSSCRLCRRVRPRRLVVRPQRDGREAVVRPQLRTHQVAPVKRTSNTAARPTPMRSSVAARLERLPSPVIRQPAPRVQTPVERLPAQRPSGDYEGTVIEVTQQPAIEQAGTPWGLVILLGVVSMIAFAVMARAWLLLLLLGFMLFFILPRFLAFFSPLLGWFLIGRRQAPQQVPVQSIVLQGDGGRRTVRVEGHLVGSVAVGDRLTVRGRWQQGILYLDGGYNLTSSHQISVQGSRNSNPVAGMIPFVVIVLVSLFLVGMCSQW